MQVSWQTVDIIDSQQAFPIPIIAVFLSEENSLFSPPDDVAEPSKRRMILSLSAIILLADIAPTARRRSRTSS